MDEKAHERFITPPSYNKPQRSESVAEYVRRLHGKGSDADGRSDDKILNLFALCFQLLLTSEVTFLQSAVFLIIKSRHALGHRISLAVIKYHIIPDVYKRQTLFCLKSIWK